MANYQPTGTFTNLESYRATFKPLIEAEILETCYQKNANIKFIPRENGNWRASFKPSKMELIKNCREGDEFSLVFISTLLNERVILAHAEEDEKDCPILPLKIQDIDSTLSRLLDRRGTTIRASPRYRVTVVNERKKAILEKQLSAIERLIDMIPTPLDLHERLGNYQDDKHLIGLLLGGVDFPVHNQLSAFDRAHDMTDRGDVASDSNASEIAELNELNESQKKALEEAQSQRLTLIDGPPGTGKTKTAAAIIYKLKAENPWRGKVLVCAQSNIAIDNIAERLDRVGHNVVGLRSREQRTSEPNQKWALDVKAKRRIREVTDRYEESECEEKLKLQRVCERIILNEADVICCTLMKAAQLWRKNIHIDTLLIDECCQATEPECLLAITLWPRRLILIGDERQLGPVVHGESSPPMTLFTRLKKRTSNAIQSRLLDRQYRMHPSISYFPNKQFYGGIISDGIQCSDRVWNFDDRSSPFLKPDEPLVFYNSTKPEENDGKSFRNSGEAKMVETILFRLVTAGIAPHQIGIICPYRAQQSYLKRDVQLMDYNKEHIIQVATVDGFQGKEKDFIIISCVRSNRQRQIGFLKDRRRLNVALTRAKYGLMIVGNANTLSSDPDWADLITHIKSEGLMRQAIADKRASLSLYSHTGQYSPSNPSGKKKYSRHYLHKVAISMGYADRLDCYREEFIYFGTIREEHAIPYRSGTNFLAYGNGRERPLSEKLCGLSIDGQ